MTRGAKACVPALMVCFVASCGESTAELIERYRPDYVKLRTKLKAVHDMLPAAVQREQPVVGKLDPAPRYDSESGAGANTDILMFEQLQDPDWDSKDAFRLRLSGFVDKLLNWTGPRSSLSESAAGGAAREETAREFEAGKNLRYLVVAKTIRHVRCRPVSAESFESGEVLLNGFLVDLTTNKILATFAVTVRPDARVEYQGTPGADRLAEWADSTMVVNARKAFVARLKAVCAIGTFTLH